MNKINNWSDQEMETIQNIQYLLKLQYFQDLKSNLEKDVQQEETYLIFADINVWFYNKECQYSISEAKYCWDKLVANLMGKINLDDFLRKYGEEILDKHNTYKIIVNKLRKILATRKRLEHELRELQAIDVIKTL